MKLQLISVRSSAPDIAILVFEGDDDKLAYRQWISRICSSLRYEPFPCRGKAQLLKLRESVKEDKSGLSEGIYYFVDRDFDDLRGYDPDDKTFLTEMYSIENYIVSEVALDSILSDHFHCHANFALRREIARKFSMSYAQFLTITRELNWRIFLHRRLGVDIEGAIPKRIARIANLTLDGATDASPSCAEAIPVPLAPEDELYKELEIEFANLEPRARFRGKFAMIFFTKWLAHLANEYTDDAGLFKDIDRTSNVRSGDLTISVLAAYAPHPNGLDAFLGAIKAPTSLAA
ncbi:DUF4435 domain-containing protein [Phenylobacterium sp.]|uniref:DUF4435 domain-containing protein n=1 Tax=Phenylobacterium sp. TaxID=1871053 RepID=UPI0035AFC4EE